METITRDKQVRGLHLREFKCSKAFYLDFTIEGKRKKVKIGEMSDCLGWNEARLKAIQRTTRRSKTKNTHYKRCFFFMECGYRFTKKVSQIRFTDV